MLAQGTRLNHYSIVRPIGSGGMGDVYEAEGTRLKRRVAIKILPERIAADPARLARFEQEALAVAALNHPNIVTIHSVEEDGGRRFLTMELVDGGTLDRCVPATGLRLGDLLDYAIPPDNRRLVAADTSDRLWLFDLPSTAWTPIGRGGYPRWLPDGRRVLAVLRGRIVLVDTTTGATADVYGEPGRFIGSLALAPGGGRVYFASAVTRSSIWMMRLSGDR